jgi:NADPH2 dehydrogenase
MACGASRPTGCFRRGHAAAGKADLVAIARAMLYDPRWPWHATAELNAKVAGPPQYWRAPPDQYKNIFNHVTFGAR